MERLLLHGPDLHRDVPEHRRQLSMLLRRVPHRTQGQDRPHLRRLQEVDQTVKHRKKRDDRSVEK